MAKFCDESLFFCLCLLLLSSRLCDSVESDFTVDVEAGSVECFFQHIKKDVNFEFEYQVIEGGDIDINFYIDSPSGVTLIAEYRKQDSVHRLQSNEEGDYKFCLDNGFSRFSNKIVFFELVTPDADPNWKSDQFVDLQQDNLDVYDMKLEDFMSVFDHIKEGLDRSQQDQNRLRSYEARDRNIGESSFERVNWWSAVQLVVMLSVSLTQVLMIRSLFEDKSKVSQILKMRT